MHTFERWWQQVLKYSLSNAQNISESTTSSFNFSQWVIHIQAYNHWGGDPGFKHTVTEKRTQKTHSYNHWEEDLISSMDKDANFPTKRGFPGGSVVKNLPAMQKLQETQVQSLGWEDPLEEGMATHSSILAWRIPCRGAWWTTVHRVAESRTQLKQLSTHTPKRSFNFCLMSNHGFLLRWSSSLRLTLYTHRLILSCVPWSQSAFSLSPCLCKCNFHFLDHSMPL